MTATEALSSNEAILVYMDESEIRSALDPERYCGDSARIARESAIMARGLSADLASQIR